MRLGPLFRGTFEVQAGNRPLQGQSKPPVFTGGFDIIIHTDRTEKTMYSAVIRIMVRRKGNGRKEKQKRASAIRK